MTKDITLAELANDPGCLSEYDPNAMDFYSAQKWIAQFLTPLKHLGHTPHYKKIEVLRKDHSDDKLFLKDPNIIAVITDGSFSAPIPIININDTQAITHFIITTLKNA